MIDKHIMIVKGNAYFDNMVDKKGNIYHFYMIDFTRGLKAYITKKELNPDEELAEQISYDNEIRDFMNDVRKNIKEDSGVERIINTFEESHKKYFPGY